MRRRSSQLPSRLPRPDRHEIRATAGAITPASSNSRHVKSPGRLAKVRCVHHPHRRLPHLQDLCRRLPHNPGQKEPPARGAQGCGLWGVMRILHRDVRLLEFRLAMIRSSRLRALHRRKSAARLIGAESLMLRAPQCTRRTAQMRLNRFCSSSSRPPTSTPPSDPGTTRGPASCDILFHGVSPRFIQPLPEHRHPRVRTSPERSVRQASCRESRHTSRVQISQKKAASDTPPASR